MARGAVRLHAAAIGLPGRRCGHPGDQMGPAAVRRPRLRRADGTGVRRPPRRGRQPDALGAPARPDGGRRTMTGVAADPPALPPAPLNAARRSVLKYAVYDGGVLGGASAEVAGSGVEGGMAMEGLDLG